MKRLVIASAMVLMFSGVTVRAEKPIDTGLGLGATVSPGELKATPEMWFYDQAMRQYKDPKAVVRANAEVRNEQRMQRIESLKWFGLSNSRPRVSADPIHGDYSPSWVSNPGYYPSRWNGVGPVPLR
jgi:hypothetical protein